MLFHTFYDLLLAKLKVGHTSSISSMEFRYLPFCSLPVFLFCFYFVLSGKGEGSWVVVGIEAYITCRKVGGNTINHCKEIKIFSLSQCCDDNKYLLKIIKMLGSVFEKQVF